MGFVYDNLVVPIAFGLSACQIYLRVDAISKKTQMCAESSMYGLWASANIATFGMGAVNVYRGIADEGVGTTRRITRIVMGAAMMVGPVVDFVFSKCCVHWHK